MKQFFILEPSVDGELGANTDQSIDPISAQHAAQLEYAIDLWSGDDLITAHPYFLATLAFKEKALDSKLTGAKFSTAAVSKSYHFNEFPANAGKALPRLFWLRATGTPGKDDIATTLKGSLVVSERCILILRALKIKNASVYRWDEMDIEHIRFDSAGQPIHIDNSSRLVQLAKTIAIIKQKL